MPDWQEARDKAILASNVTGMVSAIPATYLAVKGRKEGGIPRDMLRRAPGNSAPARAARKVAGALDNPGTNKKLRLAAGLAGGTMIGLQGMNILGDSLSAHKTMTQKKPQSTDDGLAKCYEGPQRTGFGKAITYSPTVESRPTSTAEQAAPAALAAGSAVAGRKAYTTARDLNRTVGQARRETMMPNPAVADYQRQMADLQKNPPKPRYRRVDTPQKKNPNKTNRRYEQVKQPSPSKPADRIPASRSMSQMGNPVAEVKRNVRLLASNPAKHEPTQRMYADAGRNVDQAVAGHAKKLRKIKALGATSAVLAGAAGLAEANRRRTKERNQWT